MIGNSDLKYSTMRALKLFEPSWLCCGGNEWYSQGEVGNTPYSR